ncbi:MAG: hypothetical protein QW695_01980 [Candidatus Bathyarchaeia archaeon]
MIEIGYVLSGCDQKVIPFGVREGYKVVVNGYYFIKHPLSGDTFTPVLLRVFKVTPYNPEMGLGGFGPIAGKKGEKAQYGKGLEYDVAFAEALGYIRSDGKWVRLECAPGTWDPVYQPEPYELQEFYMEITKSGRRDCFPIRIGKLKGSDVPIYLDLNSIAKGHMFVAGMSVAYWEPIVYMLRGEVRVEEIGCFVDRFFNNDSEGEIELNEEVYVPAFNPETLRLEWRPVRSVVRHRYSGPMIRIQLEDGRVVTVTPSHSVFTMRDSRIEAIEAYNLKPGDPILVPLFIPRPASYIESLDLAYTYSEDRCIQLKIALNEDIARMIAYYIVFGYSTLDEVIFRIPRHVYDDVISIVSNIRSIIPIYDFSIDYLREYIEVKLKNRALSSFFNSIKPSDDSPHIPTLLFNVKPPILRSLLETLTQLLSLGLIRSEKLVSEISYLKLITNGYDREPFQSDLALVRISKIDLVDYDYEFVYDLSIPSYENFVAGLAGVFCHNTRSGKSSFVVSLIAKDSNM